MKVLATSDLHGKLPDPTEIPVCDVFIVAGDVTPYHDHSVAFQHNWLVTEFAQWLTKIPAGEVIGIAGNHDFAFQDARSAAQLPWTYLQDSFVMVDDVKFYGTPWVPNLERWAFYARNEVLYYVYDKVPLDTDVLITHGPPLGCGDLSSPKFGSMHCGHPAVNQGMTRVRPELTICGHIHESHGLHYMDGNPLWNVARLDDNYEVRYPIVDVSEFIS